MTLREYRITKYDPSRRDEHGAFPAGDWTSFADVGKAFGGVILTPDEYARVESAYAAAAVAFLREAGVASLTVTSLETAARVPLAEGTPVGPDAAGDLVRGMLREEFWCRLEGDRAFVHVGYDLYLYVGVERACPGAEAEARRLGLFVEPCPSPYRAG